MKDARESSEHNFRVQKFRVQRLAAAYAGEHSLIHDLFFFFFLSTGTVEVRFFFLFLPVVFLFSPENKQIGNK